MIIQALSYLVNCRLSFQNGFGLEMIKISRILSFQIEFRAEMIKNGWKLSF